MMPARWDWRVPRNATCLKAIAVEGEDLRGCDQRMEVRLYGDQPGNPLVRLVEGAADSQGIWVEYSEAEQLVDGEVVTIGTSIIWVQIDRETLKNLLPFPMNGLEPNEPVRLEYDHLIALPDLPLLPMWGGVFEVVPGVTVP